MVLPLGLADSIPRHLAWRLVRSLMLDGLSDLTPVGKANFHRFLKVIVFVRLLFSGRKTRAATRCRLATTTRGQQVRILPGANANNCSQAFFLSSNSSSDIACSLLRSYSMSLWLAFPCFFAPGNFFAASPTVSSCSSSAAFTSVLGRIDELPEKWRPHFLQSPCCNLLLRSLFHSLS